MIKHATASFAVLGIFLLGLVAGIAGTHLFYAQRLERAGGPLPWMIERYHDRLARELDLSPQQMRQVDDILRRSHERAGALRHEMFPRVRAIMEEAADEIEGLLTDEQRGRYREMRQRQREWSERLMHGPPGRRHGPSHRERP